ncbi:bifunctional uridylate/adenylate kinase [Cystobasidiomycetes sp. EMM_F5]
MPAIIDKVKDALGLGQEGTATATSSGVSTPAHVSAAGQPLPQDQHALTQSESTGRNDSTGQVGLPLTMPSSSQSPAFDPAHITVIYVLGGPGAGKGTQCAKLVEHQDFVHLSAGDLLRTEQNRQGSKTGQMIKEYITEGKIVPSEVTIGLLRTAMGEAIDKQGKHRFLIDGFPRKLDQAHAFDETVCPGSAVLFLICPEQVLLERLLERGKTSGRDDDNADSIKKRFKTFIDTSMPVVDYYRKEGKVIDIDSSKSIEDVYSDISTAVNQLHRRKSLSLSRDAATA